MPTLAARLTNICLLGASLGATLHSQDLGPSKVFEKVKSSVVVVKVIANDGQLLRFGSGVKTSQGRVVTNFHVVMGGASYLVTQGNHAFAATIYASDADLDLCLLDVPELKAPGIATGHSSDLKVGSSVYAVGAPEGLELTLSNGIVSQLRGEPPPIIQTTAAVSIGSSGGGLFDGQGQLVGITSAYASGGENLNFAIPVEWIDQLHPGTSVGTKSESPSHRPADEWLTEANDLERGEKWTDLRALAKARTDSTPDDGIAWRFLGAAQFSLGEFKQAAECLRRATTLNPQDEKAAYFLGASYVATKDYAEAISAYRQAELAFPKSRAIFGGLAISQKEAGDYVAAWQTERELRNLDPKLADSLVASWSGPNSLAPEQVDEIVRNANSSVKPSPHSSDESELAMATQAYDERAGLRAIPALSRLAGKGIPKAQYLLGEIFIDGSRIHPGVRKDGPRGWGWVKKAAENGYPEAQWYLGTMCSVGTGEDGVPQSKELGFSWLQKAANKGFAQAMVELGSNYREGWGTTQSYKDALLWYRKAARKGDSSGMMLLGEMYESGQGVTQDFIEAHAWLNLASSNEKPGDSLISKMRDNLASKMSSSQLEKAQRRAKALAMEIHRDKSNATP